MCIRDRNRIRIDDGIISASANGVTADSGGGNISIDPELFTIRQSRIVSQANAGTGGNINLVATNFIADTETLISASSQRGVDGNVEIESPNHAVNPLRAVSGHIHLFSSGYFFKQKTAYEIGVRLVGSEMCIRDRFWIDRDITAATVGCDAVC